MKLPALNSAIRDCETAPWVLVVAPTTSGFLKLHLQKTPLLAELRETYPDRGETGMKLTEAGQLAREEQ